LGVACPQVKPFLLRCTNKPWPSWSGGFKRPKNQEVIMAVAADGARPE
jgi:hypothetical protein